MLKANQLEGASMAFDKVLRNVEMQVMEDIVRRIKINGEITRSADWQINRLYELGMSRRDIEKVIAENLGISKADVDRLYKDIIQKGYSHDEELYRQEGKTQIPFEENQSLQQLISATSEQTSGEINNISRSLGFAVRQPDGSLKFTEIAEYYQNTIDNAITGIASGVFDYNTVIKRVISEMTNSGLRTVDYSTGWSNRVDVAARRAVMTGLSQLTARVNEDNAAQLGTEYFEVTWHSGARPSHQVWQGRVYSRAELETVCGLGTVTGLCGANCYHDYYPFVPGISERTYTDQQLDELNAEENKKVKYNGKEYTKYEALQRQRRLETTMRAQRQKIKLLEEAGADEDDIINARCRYRGTSQEYTRFSREMGLPQQRERVTSDGLGNVGVGKYKKTVDNSGKSDIIKTGEVKILEQAKKRNHKIYITDTAIDKVGKVNLSDFSQEQIDDMQIKHKDLLRLAKEKNNSNEVLLIDDLNLKSEVQIFGDEFVVSPAQNPFAVSVIGNAKRRSLIYMHNHPSTNNFSVADLDTFICEGAIKAMSVVTNQGEVYILNKKSEYEYNKARNLMAEVFNSFDGEEIDNNEFVRRFIKQCHKGGIEYAKSK